MSYGRILETGHYIWPDGEGIHFDDVYVSNEAIDVFLARINDFRPDELKQRIANGRKIIERNKNIGDINDI